MSVPTQFVNFSRTDSLRELQNLPDSFSIRGVLSTHDQEPDTR